MSHLKIKILIQEVSMMIKPYPANVENMVSF